MSNPTSYKTVLYNKISILGFDIENALDEENPDIQHIVKKVFYFFNASSVEGKYAKPFLLKFLLDGETNDIKWNLQDIYDHFQAIPKFQLASHVLSNYNVLDNSGKIYPIKRKDQIDALSKFEKDAYTFEVNFGSVIVSEEIIKQLCSILEQKEIFYEFSDDTKNPESLIIYDPGKARYRLFISLNGKTDINNKYTVQPNIKLFNSDSITSLGKFIVFNGKATTIPNDDNFALIHQCSKCHSNFIINYWNYKGTNCPYCNSLVKFTLDCYHK